jgi:hypothetical protein
MKSRVRGVGERGNTVLFPSGVSTGIAMGLSIGRNFNKGHSRRDCPKHGVVQSLTGSTGMEMVGCLPKTARLTGHVLHDGKDRVLAKALVRVLVSVRAPVLVHPSGASMRMRTAISISKSFAPFPGLGVSMRTCRKIALKRWIVTATSRLMSRNGTQ